MDWDVYKITYLDSAGIKRRATMTGLSIRDVRTTFNGMMRIDNNPYFDCKLVRVWQSQPPSEKQKLAQKYGFIMGAIKGAQAQFDYAQRTMLVKEIESEGNPNFKTSRAIALVKSQFSKLQRDISDVFKLAGLKIK